MILEYKINKHNSTVCGYPGRDFDWSKFDWDSKEIHKFHGETYKSVGAWIDKSSIFIAEGNWYLHVPYDFTEQGTIFRVRPNESMQAGHKYRNHLVKTCKPVKKEDGWYWQLTCEN